MQSGLSPSVLSCTGTKRFLDTGTKEIETSVLSCSLAEGSINPSRKKVEASMYHTYTHCTVPKDSQIHPTQQTNLWQKEHHNTKPNQKQRAAKKRHQSMSQYSLKALFLNAWTVGRSWLLLPSSQHKTEELRKKQRASTHWKQLWDATVWLSPWRQPVTATGFRVQTPEHKHFNRLQKATVCKRHTQDLNNSAWSNPKDAYSSLA